MDRFVIGLRLGDCDRDRYLRSRLPATHAHYRGRVASHRTLFRASRSVGILVLRPSNSRRWLREHELDQPPGKPKWTTTAIGVSHCGAGCTLGDIIAEFAVFAIGLELLGRGLLPEYVGDYAALALGVLFQYFAIAPMRGMGFRDGMLAAAKADVLSLTAAGWP